MAAETVEDFISEQDAEVRVLHDAYMKATVTYAEAVEKGCSNKQRIKLLFAMHQAGREYFQKVEHEILNRDGLRGDEYKRWVREWTGSAKKVLNGILLYHERLRKQRGKVDLEATIFEPADGAYYSIQGFFAAVFPQESSAKKQEFIDAQLPASGFDQPYMPKPSSGDQWWRPLLSLLIIVVLIVAYVIGAQYVGYWTLVAIMGGVLALFVTLSIVDLKRDGKIADKGFVEILRIVFTKWFFPPPGGKSGKK